MGANLWKVVSFWRCVLCSALILSALDSLRMKCVVPITMVLGDSKKFALSNVYV